MSLDWLRANGYFESKEDSGYDRDTTFIKDFEGYSITIVHTVNYYGGQTNVYVRVIGKDPNLSYPNASYFATGFNDYAALEHRIATEIVPLLRKSPISIP